MGKVTALGNRSALIRFDSQRGASVNKETALFRSNTLLVLVFFLALWGVAPHASAADNVSGRAPERVVREGIAMEFSYEPSGKKDGGKILEAEYAQVWFRLTDEATGRSGLALEYLVEDRDVPAGDNVSLRFRLADSVTGSGKAGLNDVTM